MLGRTMGSLEHTAKQFAGQGWAVVRELHKLAPHVVLAELQQVEPVSDQQRLLHPSLLPA